MYTCCPICKTNFNVTEAQLQVAQGKVRCGSCKNVFNARQHINYRVPPSKQTSSKSTQQTTTQSSTATSAAKDKITSSNSIPKQKTAIQPESAITPKHDSAIKKSAEHINIDAIFNALDTQLSQGTYIDIAKPVEIDIREAAFDDIFDNDDDILKNKKDSSLIDSEIDLNVYESSQLDETDNEAPESFEPLNHINSYNQPDETEDTHEDSISTDFEAEHSRLENSEDDLQQHAFDFVSPTNEADVSSEDNEQLASVNKPLEITSENKDKQQADRQALHQAIDNIIKVDSTITTPFEENDADHFVIEVESEPDVELVDENDLDKLFASTDSLRISDLKFDKYKTTEEKEEHILAAIQDTIKAENEPAPEPDLTLESDEREITSFNHQVEDNVNPDSFSSDSLITDDFSESDFDPSNITLDTELESDINENEFESGINEDNFEEEIILSSAEPDDSVPHRLRDAVASLEQQPLNLQKRLLYSFAIFVLIGLLGFQLILFKSTAIANMLPVLEPFLVSMCQSLPCRYTGNHNNKQIKILNRDVRLHPKIKGALLISATIINQAGYTQPYPTILLKFTDLTGGTVAQRYFQPKEYLGLLNKPFALMPSKKPVQLNIEILDPGSDAINFQFFFL